MLNIIQEEEDLGPKVLDAIKKYNYIANRHSPWSKHSPFNIKSMA